MWKEGAGGVPRGLCRVTQKFSKMETRASSSKWMKTQNRTGAEVRDGQETTGKRAAFSEE